MANQSELDEQRKRLEGESRAVWLHEKHRATPQAASSIVATQLLDEMDQKGQKLTIRWARIAGWSGLAAALFAGVAVYQNYVSSTSDTHSQHLALPPAPILSPPQASVVSSNLPPKATNQPASKP